MTYSIYDTATGRIVRRIECGAAEIDAQLGAGEAHVDGDHDDAAFYVAGGVVVAYPARPGPWAAFDFATGQWFDPRTPEQVAGDLAAARRAAIGRINGAAGELRRTFITSIPGQEMLYLAKESEARAFIADPAPDMADYPLIAAEIGPGLTAPDAASLAQLWLNMGAQWRQVAAQIETARLGAVYAVEAAASEAEIAAIEAAFQGALP